MPTRQQVIFTDGAELILLLKGQAGREPYNFNADKVKNVSFGYEDVKLMKLLFRANRRITITVPKIGQVEFDERRHRKYFDQYLDLLREYCIKNKVTFHDFPDRA